MQVAISRQSHQVDQGQEAGHRNDAVDHVLAASIADRDRRACPALGPGVTAVVLDLITVVPGHDRVHIILEAVLVQEATLATGDVTTDAVVSEVGTMTVGHTTSPDSRTREIIQEVEVDIITEIQGITIETIAAVADPTIIIIEGVVDLEVDSREVVTGITEIAGMIGVAPVIVAGRTAVVERGSPKIP